MYSLVSFSLGNTEGILFSFAFPFKRSPINLLIFSFEYTYLIIDIFIFPKCRAIIAGKPKLRESASSKSKFSPP